MYYLRTRPATTAQQFTIDPELRKRFLEESLAEKDGVCESCSA